MKNIAVLHIMQRVYKSLYEAYHGLSWAMIDDTFAICTLNYSDSDRCHYRKQIKWRNEERVTLHDKRQWIVRYHYVV